MAPYLQWNNRYWDSEEQHLRLFIQVSPLQYYSSSIRNKWANDYVYHSQIYWDELAGSYWTKVTLHDYKAWDRASTFLLMEYVKAG